MNNRQSYLSTTFETRETENKRYIEGYFIVFNQRTELWPGFYEEVDPDAISDLSDVRALYNHDHNIVLGSTKNKTLRLEKDSLGVKGVIEVNEKDSDAVNAYERIKRGDIAGCSFGFGILKEDYVHEGDDTVAILRDIELYEVSPVTFPAYPQTMVQARRQDFEEQKDREYRAKVQNLIKRLGGENGS